MHIVELYFNAAFDYRFTRGGISIYIWNLAKKFRELGHTSSVVIPAHGKIDEVLLLYNGRKLELNIRINYLWYMIRKNGRVLMKKC